SGGTSTINSLLHLGQNAGAVGCYSLSGTGTLTVTSSTGFEYVGYSGAGTFNQSGGTNICPNIDLGEQSTGNGTYNLSGGLAHACARENVGVSGSGTFVQSGGTNLAQSLLLGTSSSGAGR